MNDETHQIVLCISTRGAWSSPICGVMYPLDILELCKVACGVRPVELEQLVGQSQL